MEIDPDPVPTGGLGGQQLAGPFVVQPCPATHRPVHPVQAQLAGHRQVGTAVVVAGGGRFRRLLAETAAAVEDRRPRRDQAQIQSEVRGRDPGLVALLLQPQFPVPEPDLGPTSRRPGQGRQGTLRRLGMPQATAGGIGDGGVGEDQVTGGEAAGVIGADAGTDPEEGELKPPLDPVRIAEPAGDIPPLDAKVRMGAGVVRKDQVPIGDDRGEWPSGQLWHIP